MFPIELQEAVKYLQSRITACTEHSDGRVGSIKDEDLIIQELQDYYGTDNVIKQKNRFWFDVELFGYKVNIKSSRMSGSADNCSSNKALVYCFTDADLKTGWSNFYQAFDNVVDLGRNYYFIVLNKNTREVHLQSLLTLAKLTSNGNNLPFQILWKENLEPIERTFEEAYAFVMSAYKESVRKLIESHNQYECL